MYEYDATIPVLVTVYIFHTKRDIFKEAGAMRIQYSQDADVLVFSFKEGRPVDSIDMKEGIILHLDDTGAPLEMEILDASKYVSMDEFNIVMPMTKHETVPIHA